MITEEQKIISWALKGNRPAIDYCNLVFRSSHIYDDLIDKDKPVSDEQIHTMMWNLLYELPSNSFFMENAAQLVILHGQYLGDYSDSVILEREHRDHGLNLSYFLRDSVSTLLIQVALIIGGKEWMNRVSIPIRQFIFNETLDSYKQALGEIK